MNNYWSSYKLAALITFITIVSACSTASNSVSLEKLDALVPEIEDVGAANMPDSIAPVVTPFGNLEFNKPVFPDLIISIIEKGANEQSLSTKAIQAAIDDVNAQGGGTVIVPAGKWKTGRIELKSNVNLHIEENAELYFSGEIEDYLPAVFTRNEGIELMSLGACIYANGQNNIAITGKGKLIGPADGPVRSRIMTHDVIENVVPLNRPVSERVFEGKNEEFIFPPMFISPINCKNVYIEGISLENTAFWNIVPIYCDGVIIRGVTVNSVGIPRGDGIDVESSKNVLIEYCTLSTGDDCFTIKAGRGEDGIRVNKPTENVVIRYSLAKEGHGGITIGSETAGMIRNLYVHDCVFEGTGVGIRFKTRRPRGGGGENLYYERIRMSLENTAFRWDMLGSSVHVGEAADRTVKVEVNPLTPSFKNIEIKDIIIEKSSDFVKIDGIPESPLQNVLIENVIANSERLFSASDAKDLTFRNIELTSQDSVLHFVDSENILFDNVQFNNQNKKVTKDIKGGDPSTIQIKN